MKEAFLSNKIIKIPNVGGLMLGCCQVEDWAELVHFFSTIKSSSMLMAGEAAAAGKLMTVNW